MLKLIIIFVCALSFSSVITADSIIDIATQQARDLDEKMILVDPTAALSTEQKQLVIELFVEKITKTKELKASNFIDVDTQIKFLMQDIMKRLHYNILNKKQRGAKFEYQKLYQIK